MNILLINGSKNNDKMGEKIVHIVENTLKELEVDITKINLKDENQITINFQDLFSRVDGIILYFTVEWFGIGTLMQKFLDKCWEQNKKQWIENKECLVISISRKFGEREATEYISRAWNVLGGKTPDVLMGQISSVEQLDNETDLQVIIEKKAEDYYRSINKKRKSLPLSGYTSYVSDENLNIDNTEIQKNSEENITTWVAPALGHDLTNPENKENKQASKINYNTFIKKQEDDILELTQLFKKKLKTTTEDKYLQIERTIQKIFQANVAKDVQAIYQIHLQGVENIDFIIQIDNGQLECRKGIDECPDITITTELSLWDDILSKKLKAQTGFLQGKMKVKGYLLLLNTFDKIFLEN